MPKKSIINFLGLTTVFFFVADCIMTEILLKRHPNVFFNHFVECIFYFNSFEANKCGYNLSIITRKILLNFSILNNFKYIFVSVYNAFTQTEKEKKMFAMDGQTNLGYKKRLLYF